MKKNKIGIISMKTWDKEPDENVKRFAQEAKKLKLKPFILSYDLFSLNFTNEKIEIFYDEKIFNYQDFKLIIPCISIFNDDNKIFFLETLEKLGVKIKNSLKGVLVAKNKSKTLLALQTAGIPIVPSAITNSEYRLNSIFALIGEKDYIYRLNQGSLGKGVANLDSKLSMISTFELLSTAGISASRIIFQKFIKESAGRDMRVIVVNKKIIASMERHFNGFDFRANLSSGGKGEHIKLTKEMKQLAIKSVEAVGLDYGGVDILISNKGPLVIEVNANPGVVIEQVTKENVIGKILKSLI